MKNRKGPYRRPHRLNSVFPSNFDYSPGWQIRRMQARRMKPLSLTQLMQVRKDMRVDWT